MKIVILLCFFAFCLAFADLEVGFYSSTCPRAESIVRQVVRQQFNSDKTITAALLRMHYHDCFVRGCDASILIDSTEKNTAEKEAITNSDVRGFDLIDDIKETLEDACPSTVSCADIITLSTRDAVALSGGPKYEVPTGRRDGLVSTVSEVGIPGPGVSVAGASQFFAEKGITTEEMVILFGAHTVGVAHCRFFQGRLSNGDSTMDPALKAKLVKLCSNSTGGIRDDPDAFLDQKTPFKFDSEFYRQILLKRGILQIDQQLALDSSTKTFVTGFASNDAKFQKSFADAMIKMGKIDVLVGNAGEIRKNCRVFNNATRAN